MSLKVLFLIQLFLNIFFYTICPVPVVNINILRLGKSHKTVLFTDILEI